MDSSKNQNAAMLGDIVKTCDMGKSAIKQLLPHVKSQKLRRLAESQYREYDAIGDLAMKSLKAQGKPTERAPGAAKIMSACMIQMQSMQKNSDRGMAKLLFNGSSTGIAKTGGNLNHLANVQPQTRELAKRLLAFEQQNAQELMPYL